jgi:Dodecin
MVVRANKTAKNVKGAWVKDREVTVDGGEVTGYRVVLKATFILTDRLRRGLRSARMQGHVPALASAR